MHRKGSNMIRLDCPKCAQSLQISDDMAGKRGKCPKCGNVVLIPSAPKPPDLLPDPAPVRSPVVRAPQVSPMDELAAAVVARAPTRTYPPPRSHARVDVNVSPINVHVRGMPKATSGLGVAALVMGILACMGCWIPFLNVVSMFFAGLGLLFGFIGLLASAVGRRSGIGMPVAGIIVCVVALVVAVAITGSAAVTLDRAINEVDRANMASPPAAEEHPVLTVSAAELYAEYKANEVAADQRYKGRVVAVSGVVDNIGKGIMGTMYVALDTGEMVGSVQCMFGKEHANSLAGLSKGQSVTIQGKCTGKMMNVLLDGCALK